MRRAVLAALATLLLVVPSALASVYTYSGVANRLTDFRYDFTTQLAGDVVARIVWKPKANGGYTLNLRRNAVCGANETATEVYVIQTVSQPNGDWTITVPGAAATVLGECWRVDFWAYAGGRVPATLTVTTPD